MGMTPESIYGEIPETNDNIRPSKTYKMDFATKRIIGYVDDFEAIVQTIHKILNTERFAYEIYGANYGGEIETLLGKDNDYVKSVLPQRIEEALTNDDRIINIENFIMISIGKDSIHASFTVNTIYGLYDFIGEVT